MTRLASAPGVYKVDAHQCAFGLMSEDGEGVGPVKKPTSFLTNSVKVCQRLDRKCPGCPRHVTLMEGRARAAQQYPEALCRAICQGTLDQASADAARLVGMKCEIEDVNGEVNSVEHEAEEWEQYWDDLAGAELPQDLVREARTEELSVIKSMGVWEERSRE